MTKEFYVDDQLFVRAPLFPHMKQFDEAHNIKNVGGVSHPARIYNNLCEEKGEKESRSARGPTYATDNERLNQLNGMVLRTNVLWIIPAWPRRIAVQCRKIPIQRDSE